MTKAAIKHENGNSSPKPRLVSDEGDHARSSEDNHVHLMLDQMQRLLAETKSDSVDGQSPTGACLLALLAALGWAGEARHLAEAMPHVDPINDIDGLRTVLARINFATAPRQMTSAELSLDHIPCLFAHASGKLYCINAVDEEGRLNVFDGQTKTYTKIEPDRKRGTAYLVTPVDSNSAEHNLRTTGWMQALLLKFKHTFAVLFGLSLAINVLTLAVPVYILTVYQLAIGAKSVSTLLSLLAGVVIAVALELSLRRIRGRALTYLGTRIENLIAHRVFQQLCHMPTSFTESASIGAQLTRFRQFEGMREMFSGSLATAILDIPFLAIFVVAVFVIGGPLGLIPLSLIVIYLIMAAIAVPLSAIQLRRTGVLRARRRNFLMELTNKQKAIRSNQAQETWLKRFRDINAQYLQGNAKAQQFNMAVQICAESLLVLAGVATIGVGALLVLNNELTIAALIATTALVWRGLSPLQSAFLGLSQIGHFVESFRQVNHLLRLPQERNTGSLPTIARKFHGKIVLRSVSLRYSNGSEPALYNISLNVKAGEFVAITGDSGAGKSTLLRVIAGLQRPQSGSVFIDGLDLRQFEVAEVRQAIGYVPQKQELFYGTIAQNIRLSHPTATIQEIESALKKVGVLDEILQLPDGIHTRLQGIRETSRSPGFLALISLARAFVKSAPIYLLDEPASNIDKKSDAQFARLLLELKERATIIMVTHRPSHMKCAHRVIVLRGGRVEKDDSPDNIVPGLIEGTTRTSGNHKRKNPQK